VVLALGLGAISASPAVAQEKKPNILIIWGDDIGGFNISAYNDGIMGYRTPNIDRIARDGAMFTDWYGHQSCTAGRAAFITGQSPIRTGLTKVGLPGAPEGMKREDPTIATLLKPLGYATGQFGKNHLGDRDEMLPTANGFDEFFGNLYHLNAEEEPENIDYPKKPEFKKKFGPRGVIHSWAMADGTQKIEDTGPLTKKRMETVDMYSTDNGAETFTWPDGGTTMFRGEKNTQWEGGYRVPTLIRWPGTIKPGTVINEIAAHEDMMPTLLAAAGDPNVAAELLKGKTIGDQTYKVHLDGYDLAPALKGAGEWPRKEFIYWTDDGNVAALRYDNWKVTFLEQKAEGMRVWQEPFDALRAPLLANLRMDPFERAREEDAMGYQRWWIEHMYVIAPASAYVGQWLQSFRDFPPRQKPGSFNLDRVMEAVTAGSQGKQ
jgi:arylsulfatase A-like enzyme